MNAINQEMITQAWEESQSYSFSRICHITSMHDWDDDRIFQRACAGLARKGFEVHLVAMAGPDQEIAEFQKLGVTVHLVPRLQGVSRRWKGSRAVVKLAASLNADIYQFHDPDLLPHINPLKSGKSALVYDIHENYAGRFADWGLPAFLGSWFRKYELTKINGLDGITVVSSSMKHLFSGSNTPVEITRNSTDIERLRGINLNYHVEKNHIEIITSGSHSHARNCLQTVQSIPHLNALSQTKVRFRFAGRYLQSIEEEMRQVSLADETSEQLILDGMLPWEENFSRLAAADVGCVFYEDNPNNRVGIPNRLFEYMYCGLPVAVSDFPELRNIVESADCGVVVNSEDPSDIARGLAQIIADPQRARQMGANGKKAIEEVYGYHVDLENLVKFYQRIYPG